VTVTTHTLAACGAHIEPVAGTLSEPAHRVRASGAFSPVHVAYLLACGSCHEALQAHEGHHVADHVEPVVGAAGAHAASPLQLVHIVAIQAGCAPGAVAADATAGHSSNAESEVCLLRDVVACKQLPVTGYMQLARHWQVGGRSVMVQRSGASSGHRHLKG
jgi:hypothetical protein